MDPVLIYVAIFGIFLGLIVGMTSIGNGLIGMPGLVFLGLSPTVAVGTVGVSGFFMMSTSAFKHFRNENIDTKAGFAFSITAVPGAFFFAKFKEQINAKVSLTNIIAGVIILSVITLVYKFFFKKTSANDQEDANYDGSKFPAWCISLLGLILGFFIGATSIAGSLIVISFMLILKMPERLAIGTTNFVAIFSLAAASVAHIINGDVDWLKLLVFTPMVMTGAYFGAGLTKVVPQKPLRIIILGLLLIAGVGIIFKKSNNSAENATAPSSQTNQLVTQKHHKPC